MLRDRIRCLLQWVNYSTATATFPRTQCLFVLVLYIFWLRHLAPTHALFLYLQLLIFHLDLNDSVALLGFHSAHSSFSLLPLLLVS
ncbi:hypothetical protein EI94DRAFT_1750319 [Lactarius quietus]|nr:hypothetical protein EI94DRAFT_1750319 [Lactarius quietus]